MRLAHTGESKAALMSLYTVSRSRGIGDWPSVESSAFGFSSPARRRADRVQRVDERDREQEQRAEGEAGEDGKVPHDEEVGKRHRRDADDGGDRRDEERSTRTPPDEREDLVARLAFRRVLEVL